MRVGIVGGSGYGGAELLRLLAEHPLLDVEVVAAAASAGKRVDEVFPHLRGLPGAEAVLVASEVDALADCELVFLATPHATSLDLAPPLLAAGARVVDLSGAFRLAPEVFSAWYGLEHTAAALAPAPYGLPELFRDDLAGAALVAGPGCYPTAALLGLVPLSGLVEADGVAVVGMSGTSGAGKSLREDLHASHMFGNVTPYGAPRHRHTPEIEAHWAEAARREGLAEIAGLEGPQPVTFVPHLVPMARGMLATVTAPLRAGVDAGEVRAAFDRRYGPEPFVAVLPEGTWPATTHVAGGNAAHLGVAVDDRSGTVTVSCAIDNLLKGASGQAVQAANAALGYDETLGLRSAGLYP